MRNFSAELHQVQTSRESALCEVSELKVQLRIVEESRDGFRQNLTEAKRQLREGLSAVTNHVQLL